MKTTNLHTSRIARTAACIFAALSLGAITASAAFDKVAVDLSGKEFGQKVVTDPITGATRIVSVNLHALGGRRLNPAISYKYTITGTVHGTGALAGSVPAGTALTDYFPATTLMRTYDNPSGTLPIVVINKVVTSTQNIGGFPVTFSLRVKAGVGSLGVVYVNLKNFSTIPSVAVNATIQFDPGAKMYIVARH